jgi:hypothetical protein
LFVATSGLIVVVISGSQERDSQGWGEMHRTDDPNIGLRCALRVEFQPSRYDDRDSPSPEATPGLYPQIRPPNTNLSLRIALRRERAMARIRMFGKPTPRLAGRGEGALGVACLATLLGRAQACLSPRRRFVRAHHEAFVHTRQQFCDSGVLKFAERQHGGSGEALAPHLDCFP